MAGLGRQVFTAGEVLTAADVNGYLMDQAVMVFADATARTAAIAAPTEGMVTYLSDTNVLYLYDGSAWEAVDTTASGLACRRLSCRRNHSTNPNFCRFG
jgi:hypothetical protein